MRVKFRGWSREVYEHDHKVEPVDKEGGFLGVGKRAAVTVVEDQVKVLGKVSGLGLSGDFLVSLFLSEDDLKNILEEKIRADPTKELEFLGALQAKAMAASFEKIAAVAEEE